MVATSDKGGYRSEVLQWQHGPPPVLNGQVQGRRYRMFMSDVECTGAWQVTWCYGLCCCTSVVYLYAALPKIQILCCILALTGFSDQSMSKTYKISSPQSFQGMLLLVHSRGEIKIDNVVQCLGIPKCSHKCASGWRSSGAHLHRFLAWRNCQGEKLGMFKAGHSSQASPIIPLSHISLKGNYYKLGLWWGDI